LRTVRIRRIDLEREVHMASKISTRIGWIAAGLASLSMVAAAGSASADPRHYRRHHDKGGKTEAAIVAGVVGLALGAAIASGNDNDRYDRSYDDRRYYGPPPPPPRYHYREYRRSDCWTTRDYDYRSDTVYERTVCR
jgi:hypothetical protein